MINKETATEIAYDGRQSPWRGIRDDYLTWLHSRESEVEVLLEELEALKLLA
jgi:hypothetical protein